MIVFNWFMVVEGFIIGFSENLWFFFETNLDFATLKVCLVVSFVLGTAFGSLLVHHFDSFWGPTNDKIPWSLFHRYLTNSRLN